MVLICHLVLAQMDSSTCLCSTPGFILSLTRVFLIVRAYNCARYVKGDPGSLKNVRSPCTKQAAQRDKTYKLANTGSTPSCSVNPDS